MYPFAGAHMTIWVFKFVSNFIPNRFLFLRMSDDNTGLKGVAIYVDFVWLFRPHRVHFAPFHTYSMVVDIL